MSHYVKINKFFSIFVLFVVATGNVSASAQEKDDHDRALTADQSVNLRALNDYQVAALNALTSIQSNESEARALKQSTMDWRDTTSHYAVEAYEEKIKAEISANLAASYATAAKNFATYETATFVSINNVGSYETAALVSKEMAAGYETAALASKDRIVGYEGDALASASNAAGYETAALVSKDRIVGYEGDALASASNAAGYETAAFELVDLAASYATAASTGAAHAVSYANDAASYEVSASLSADNAAGYEAAASISASNAAFQVSSIVSSTVDNVSAYETAASISARNADNYEAAALISKNMAAGYEGDALASASNAADYEAAALVSKDRIVGYETAAFESVDLTASYARAASTGAVHAVSYASDAASYEISASLSADNVAGYETAAFISASNAASQVFSIVSSTVDNVSAYETAASISASNADNYEAAALISKNMASGYEAAASISASNAVSQASSIVDNLASYVVAASTGANMAASYETAASISASNAASQASSIVSSAVGNVSGYEAAASISANNADGYEAAALFSKNMAAGYETAALISASNAASQASSIVGNVASYATAASTDASMAASYAINASTGAVNAGSYESLAYVALGETIDYRRLAIDSANDVILHNSHLSLFNIQGLNVVDTTLAEVVAAGSLLGSIGRSLAVIGRNSYTSANNLNFAGMVVQDSAGALQNMFDANNADSSAYSGLLLGAYNIAVGLQTLTLSSELDLASLISLVRGVSYFASTLDRVVITTPSNGSFGAVDNTVLVPVAQIAQTVSVALTQLLSHELVDEEVNDLGRASCEVLHQLVLNLLNPAMPGGSADTDRLRVIAQLITPVALAMVSVVVYSDASADDVLAVDTLYRSLFNALAVSIYTHAAYDYTVLGYLINSYSSLSLILKAEASNRNYCVDATMKGQIADLLVNLAGAMNTMIQASSTALAAAAAADSLFIMNAQEDLRNFVDVMDGLVASFVLNNTAIEAAAIQASTAVTNITNEETVQVAGNRIHAYAQAIAAVL